MNRGKSAFLEVPCGQADTTIDSPVGASSDMPDEDSHQKMKSSVKRIRYWALSLISMAACNGCAVLSIEDTLPRAVLNQTDPAIARDGMPSFLIVMDALVSTDPDDVGYLLTSAKLYSTYATAFVGHNAERRRKLADRAYDYAHRALCEESQPLCRAVDQPFDQFDAALTRRVDAIDIDILYGFVSAWATWLQANADDWQAIAQLPKIKRGFETVLAKNARHDGGNVHLALAVLESQIPPSLGGKPSVAREHFERAITVANERNLYAKVLYAEHYARLIFDQILHDRLLNEVINANPVAQNLTLSNTLAQERAYYLLAESVDFFE